MSRIFDELLRVRSLGADFLQPKYEDCWPPELIPDMTKAVARLKTAVKQQEKVLIYGDYDVDGVTASTLLADTLRLIGLTEVEVMLPNRFTDGYGMSTKVVQRARETGVKLVITVDCGSRNHEIINALRQEGVEVIVTDHHECDDTLPDALAVLNPKRSDAAEIAKMIELPAKKRTQALAELRELAGVGVAFKLAQALTQAGLLPMGQEKWLLDLVVVGTICDSMVLRGENRRLCYYGLMVLAKTRRPGLKELLRSAGVRRLSSDAIGFQIGPRLNAAGRMETAEKALALLMTGQKTLAARLSEELEQLNRERKAEQQQAMREISVRGVDTEPVIVECGEWHEGVLGIIAGRLVEEYQRPAFALAEVGGILKGSGRSFGEFNLAEALKACSQHLVGGGGHAGACGLKLQPDRLEAFKQAVNAYYRSLKLTEQERFLGVHEDLAVMDFEELTLELIAELRQLEPFGTGNEEPIFLLPEVRVADVARLGEEANHLRLTVWDAAGTSLKLMRFFAPQADLQLQPGDIVNAWITLNDNEFRGIRSVEGRILQLKPA